MSYALADSFSSSSSGPVTYSAQNLPQGLSLDPSTGLISGTIALQTHLHSPFDVTTSVTQSDYTVQTTIEWTVDSTISIFPNDPVIHETVPITLTPVPNR